jgi:hypothetical protein
MSFRRKVNRFIVTCLIGGLLGAAFCGIGTLIYQHSFSEQRRLWTPSKFVISPDSFKENSHYVNLSFTPKGKERHFIKLCISPAGHKQYEKPRNADIPSVDWQVLNAGQSTHIEIYSDRGWSWSSSDGTCTDLGLFQGMIGQEHQIRFRVNQLEPPPPNSQLILTVRPDVMATKGKITMYQLTGLIFQLVGVATFVVFVFKGLFGFLKTGNARKDEV